MNRDTQQNKENLISPLVLGKICKEIGEMDSAYYLQKLLIDCGIAPELIEYPETKWKMIYKALNIYNSSLTEISPKPLYRVIETACHPIMHESDTEAAEKIKHKFNAILDYDGSYIDNSGELYLRSEISGEDDHYEFWVDRNGKTVEASCYTVQPDELATIRVFWVEIINLTTLYLEVSDKSMLDEDILNTLYCESISKVEGTLEKDNCGRLLETYRKPYSQISGLEYEIGARGESQQQLLMKLYSFLSDIDQAYPSKYMKEFIKNAEEENVKLLVSIRSHIKNEKSKKSSWGSDQKYIPREPLEVIIKNPLSIDKIPAVSLETNSTKERFYWFDEDTFNLRLIDRSLVVVSFGRTGKSAKSAPLHLIRAYCQLLTERGSVIEQDNIKWLSVFLTKEDILSKLSSDVTTDADWLRYTKSNLMKTIPQQYLKHFIIGNYEKNEDNVGGYQFAIKYPF